MSADDSGGTMLWSGVTDINDIDTGDEGEGVGESGDTILSFCYQYLAFSEYP